MSLGDQHLSGDQDVETFKGVENESDFPGGCYECPQNSNTCGKGTWFNTHTTGQGNAKSRVYCARPTLSLEQPESGIIFIGDSDVDYWRDSDVVFPGSFNYGVAGDTCANVNKYLSELLKVVKDVKVIVLVCGENDLVSTSPSITFKRFKKVYRIARRQNIRVIMMGTKPEPDTTDLHADYRKYDQLLKRFARRVAKKNSDSPPFIFIDVYQSFKSIGNPKSLYDNDELHLSAKGYTYWKAWVRNAYENAICDDATDVCNCYLWKKKSCRGKV